LKAALHVSEAHIKHVHEEEERWTEAVHVKQVEEEEKMQ